MILKAILMVYHQRGSAGRGGGGMGKKLCPIRGDKDQVEDDRLKPERRRGAVYQLPNTSRGEGGRRRTLA